MNDFTREELEDLECWLRVTSKQDITLPNNKDLEYLRDKIQSMIDNYCEHDCNHEWDGVLLTVKPNTGKCKKCGQVCYIAIKDIE